jgi:hypothetical protein
MTPHNDSEAEFIEVLTINGCLEISNSILTSHDQRMQFHSIIDELLGLASASFTDQAPWAIHFEAKAADGTSQTITLPRAQYVLADRHLLLDILNYCFGDKFEVDRNSELICANWDGTLKSARWDDERGFLEALCNDGPLVTLVFVALKAKSG